MVLRLEGEDRFGAGVMHLTDDKLLGFTFLFSFSFLQLFPSNLLNIHTYIFIHFIGVTLKLLLAYRK